MINYYDILEVSEFATTSEIKKSYRKLAQILHPDKGGDVAKFQELQEAYSTLTDPYKRSQYEYDFHADLRSAAEAMAAAQAQERQRAQEAQDLADEQMTQKEIDKEVNEGLKMLVVVILSIIAAIVLLCFIFGTVNVVTFGIVALIAYVYFFG